jgi:formate--tetrahydrofolate ligase
MPDKNAVLKGLPPRRISEVAAELGLDTERILPHGHYIAKIPIGELESRQRQPDGQLILVTAMTPTPQGEGKTTATIGLADALRRLGKKSMFCLREPSLGPYFGIKGGGTGGGRAQVVPAEDITTSILSVTCMRSRRPTIFSARWWTTISSTATNSASTRAASSSAG